jgi:sRNA-binding protein
MTSPHQIERQRGIQEASQQLGALRERWPLAFPVQHQEIRPLALGVAHQVAAGMGWSLPYTLSVLRRRKMAAVYCQAVLSHDQRIALDGAPAEAVDAEAKELATKQLARIEARNTVKKKGHGARQAYAGAANRSGARKAVAPAQSAPAVTPHGGWGIPQAAGDDEGPRRSADAE